MSGPFVPEDLIDRLCELHRRVIACWQSPTGQPPPRRARSMEPKFQDSDTIIFATVELEKQAHDLKELRETIAFIQPALPVLRNVLGTIGLQLGKAKAEEMIAAVDALAKSSSENGQELSVTGPRPTDECPTLQFGDGPKGGGRHGYA